MLKPDAALHPEPHEMLPPGWQVIHRSSGSEERTFYDTFEWHAFEKGMALVKIKNRFCMLDLASGSEITSVLFTRKPAFFPVTLIPEGEFKKRLLSCTTLRSLIRHCTIKTETLSYRILDSNEKTIAFLSRESLSLVGPEKPEPFATLFSFTPLKGYHEEIEQFAASLSSHEEVAERCEFRDLFALIMHHAGCSEKRYSPKIQLHLERDAPVHESVRQLLQATLTQMQQNEAGIRKDIDSEFLHDYRVALRRSRSILKQLKGVFELEALTRYQEMLKELGKRSNTLRDRDVSLLQQTALATSLPPELRPSLTLFFNEIAESRTQLHRKFCRYLASPSYRSFLEEWEAFITEPSLPDPLQAPNASRATHEVAVAAIKKAWKKLLRHGRKISREATDSELHALRIDCKKLRYLLEFFSSLFGHKTMTPAIRHLKELQENLGNFVDAAIQLQMLHRHLLSLPPTDNPTLSAASTGGLMTIIYQKQEKARNTFHEAFRAFDDEKTHHLFHTLITCPIEP